jgi:gliding motility-associated-like protein
MKIVWTIAFALLLFSPESQAQKKLKRQVLSSLGGSTVVAAKGLTYTFGQPPSVGTERSTKNKLRQGFQQPPRFKAKIPCANADFTTKELNSTTNKCGAYFRFEYTGDAPTGSEILWDFGEDAVPKASTSFVPDSVFYTKPGNKVVRLSIKTPSCSDSRTQNVFVAQSGFGVLLTLTDVQCGVGDSKATIKALGGTAPYTYKWSNNATDTIIKNVAGGKYGVSVTDATGCRYSTFFRISESKPVVLVATVKDVTCNNDKDGAIKLEIKSGIAPFAFKWSNSTSISKEITGAATGEHRVTITDGNGCKRDTTFKIEEYCKKIKDANTRFNVFSPNNDGDNDVFIIPGLENFPENEVQIFNRWGNIVYEKKGYNNQWKGTTTTGADLPAAAYYYIVKLNDAGKTSFNGAVTILR